MTVQQASAGSNVSRSGEQEPELTGVGHRGSRGEWQGAHPYAAAVRRAMESSRLTAADLANTTGYSYEQVRRVLKGEPIVSDQLNGLLCARLSLDVASMWALALHEKSIRKHGPDSTDGGTAEEQRRLLTAFARLDDADRRRVFRLLDRLEHATDPRES
jgi:transcriptional regulator with XRE-family HTH domain